jgi:hypothetical protein
LELVDRQDLDLFREVFTELMVEILLLHLLQIHIIFCQRVVVEEKHNLLLLDRLWLLVVLVEEEFHTEQDHQTQFNQHKTLITQAF